jgi:hypothetical protein
MKTILTLNTFCWKFQFALLTAKIKKSSLKCLDRSLYTFLLEHINCTAWGGIRWDISIHAYNIF